MDGVTCFLGVVVFLLTVLGVVGLLNLYVITLVLAVAAIPIAVHLYKNGSVNAIPDKFTSLIERGPVISYRTWGILFGLVWGGLSLLLVALAEPSTIVDGLTYHLSIPVNWWRAQRLTVFYLPFSDYSNSYFPGTGALLYFWAMAPFRSAVFVRLVSLAMWLVFGLALYDLFSYAGSSQKVGLMAAVLFLFTPLVQSQATDLSLDMTAGALFSLSLSYLVRLYRNWSVRDLILFAISSGIFMGVKYSGPAYVLLLFLGLTWVLFARRPRMSISLSNRVVYASVWWAGVALWGGYWYVRNLWLTGNPLFPLSIGLGDRILFSGCYPGGHYDGRTILGHWSQVGSVDLIRSLVIGYGAAYWMAAVFFLGALLLGVWRLLRERKTLSLPLLSKGQFLFLMSLIGIGSMALYLRTPYSVMRFSGELTPPTVIELTAGMRFSLIAGVLILFVALWGNRSIGSFSRVLMIILTAMGLVQGVAMGYDGIRGGFFGSRAFSTPRLMVTFLLSLLSLGTAWYVLRRGPTWVKRIGRSHPRTVFLVLFAILLGFIVSFIGLRTVSQYRQNLDLHVYAREYGALGEGWGWVRSNIADSKVAFVGFPLSYPLYGKSWSNEVRYINIIGDLDDRYHDFCSRDIFYRSDSGGYETWAQNLEQWNAQYIVFSRLPPGDLPEGRWIAEHPESFELLFSNPEFHVYGIK
jgi:hypothetical protein